MPSSVCEASVAGVSAGGATVRVYRSVEELESIRPAWVAWQQHPLSDFDFYAHRLQHTAGDIRPHVFVLYREGMPQTMLIGWTYDRRLSFKVGYWNVVRTRARVLSFPYGGLLGDASAENCALLMRELVASLRRGEADLAMLDHLRADTPMGQAASSAASAFARDYFPTSQQHWQLRVPGSIEDIYRRWSAKARKNAKWQHRKFLQDNDRVEVRCFQHAEELDGMFRDVELVARQTYQRGLGVGFEDTGGMRERLELEAKKGWLRAHVLYAGGKPVAFWIGTLYQGTFHSNFMGYDQLYAKYSPGMFLLTSVIEQFCKAGEAERIDFGLGHAEYKERFADSGWEEQSLWVFAPTLRGVRLNLLRTPPLLMDRCARRVLGQSGLFGKVKKIWRDRLRPGARQPRKDAPGVAA